MTSIGPLATVAATGDTWRGPESFWYQVATEGGTGWAEVEHLAFLGAVDDATAEVVAALGSVPSATTIEALGLDAIAPFLSTEPATAVTMTVAPGTGGVDDITYDLIEVGDDALRGVRMRIRASNEGSGFVLESVERTALCARGLSGAGCS